MPRPAPGTGPPVRVRGAGHSPPVIGTIWARQFAYSGEAPGVHSLTISVRTGAPGYTSHYQLVDLTAVDFEKAKDVLSKRRAHRDEV